MTDMTAHSKSPMDYSPLFIPILAVIVILWFSLILALGARGDFTGPPDQPPIPVAIAVLLPPLLFLGLMRVSSSFRRQILAINPVWIAAVMGLRILGAAFLVLYAFGHLPGLFAHPAGWGDMTVAVLAPFMAARLSRDPSFLASPWYWRYHVLGMLDFVSAVGTAIVARSAALDLNGVVGMTLGSLPLVLIPAFAVPLWICFHLIAFAQIREARRVAVA